MKTAHEIVSAIGGCIVYGDPSTRIACVKPIESASEESVTFISKPKFAPYLKSSPAGLLIVSTGLFHRDQPTRASAVLEHRDPYLAFAKVAQLLQKRVPAPEGVHPTAVIEEGATVHSSASLGPFVFVGRGASIAANVVLYPGVHVEAGAKVGAGSVLFDHVVVRHDCEVGARCVLHPGAVIGADGFGFAQDESTAEDGLVHQKIPQTGVAIVEDDVEIGANSCVDRGALGRTLVGRGTKIDNLVQVGHNVEIGPASLLVSQSGIAGSTRLGRRVILAGQAGVAGHLTVAPGSVIGPGAGQLSNLKKKQEVMGFPAVEKRAFLRSHFKLQALPKLFDRVKKLERLVERLSR